MSERDLYVVTLDHPSAGAVRDLRRLLKALARGYGFRAVRVERTPLAPCAISESRNLVDRAEVESIAEVTARAKTGRGRK